MDLVAELHKVRWGCWNATVVMLTVPVLVLVLVQMLVLVLVLVVTLALVLGLGLWPMLGTILRMTHRMAA